MIGDIGVSNAVIDEYRRENEVLLVPKKFEARIGSSTDATKGGKSRFTLVSIETAVRDPNLDRMMPLHLLNAGQ